MATNKLRKRLLDGADDQTLSRMTENFCMIGTPLPSLDSKKDANEYKPIWEQEVLDEQGRRRFHGAFTGGFSAGYYNSVGSKEGWTPSTFKSSRKDKDKRTSGGQGVGSKPEDFMDEEDLESLREGRGALSSTQTYGIEQTVQAERDPLMAMLGIDEGTDAKQTKNRDTLGLLQVFSSSLGTRLLQRMGWHPGQGLGSRVSFKRRNEMLKVLGRPVSDDGKEDKEAEKHLWPPPDTPMPVFSTKQDAKGLGWAGQDQSVSLDQALKRARAESASNSAAGKKTNGFGLGALEDDSDGEDDVYSIGNRREESTLATKDSHRWNSGNDRIVLGMGTGMKEAKPKQVEERKEGSENVWHDGRAVLSGFRIATRSTAKEVWFAAPDVPDGWEPDPQLVWSKGSAEKSKGQPGVNITSADRASILGEARLPGPPPSIQDYLSQKDKERLQRGIDAAKSHAKGGLGSNAAVEQTSSQDIPRLDAAIAKSALQGFIPFSSEPDKQARYRAYLSSQVDTSHQFSSAIQPSQNQTHQQFISELNDFAKSASIFKPLSIVMASRFQSSVSGSSEVPQINPGLHKPEPKPVLSKGEEEERIKGKEDEKQSEEMQTMTSLQRNARLGLFGNETTREVKIWKPSRLLCKRFNVHMPHPDEEEKIKGEDEEDELKVALGSNKIRQMDIPKVNARWEESKRQLQQLAAQRSTENDQVETSLKGDAINHESRQSQLGSSGVVDVNNIGLGEVQEKEEEVAFVKPPMDVFKAVFADDDEEEEEKEGEDGKEEGIAVTDGKERAEKIKYGTSLAHVQAETPSQVQSSQKGDEDHQRPTFVPRKRQTEEVEGIKVDKKKRKEKIKSLLTFSIDEEEEEEDGNERVKPASKKSRPRATDLFN